MMTQLWLTLACRDGLHVLNEVHLKPGQIRFIPHIPMGAHFTVHDADANYRQGVIHLRIDPHKARIVAYPSGNQVSNSQGYGVGRVIPAFREIRGVISLSGAAAPPSFPMSILEGQTRRIKEREGSLGRVIPLRPFADWVGFDWILVEPGNVAAFETWTKGVGQAQLLATDTEPWLGLAVSGAQIGLLNSAEQTGSTGIYTGFPSSSPRLAP